MINLTQQQIKKNKESASDSPTSDFTKKVRDSLIKKGFFLPIDETDENASRKPLTPVPTTSTAPPQ